MFSKVQAGGITSEKRESRYSLNGLNSYNRKNPKKKKILESDREFAAVLVPTISISKPAGDAMKAYQTLYPNANDISAKQNGNKRMRSPEVQTAIQERLEVLGLTQDLAIKPIITTLKATPAGNPRYSDILNASKMALQLHGIFDNKGESSGDSL